MDIENINSNIRSSTSLNGGKTPSSKVMNCEFNKKPFETPRSSTKLSSLSAEINPTFNRSSSPTDSFASSLTNSTTSSKECLKMNKMQSSSEIIKKVHALKERWAKNKEIKKNQNKLSRELNIKKLQDDCDIAAEARRKAAEKHKEILDRQKKEENDLLTSSLKDRSQLAADLEREAKARRRISVFLNNKMKKNAQQKEQELQAIEKQREINLHASRRLDFLALREAKKDEENRKRESLAMRGAKAVADRKVVESLAKQAYMKERDLIDSRLDNRIDDHNAKYQQLRRVRDSLCSRLNTWRMQRAAQKSDDLAEHEQQSEAYRLRQEDWKDIQRYKDSQERRERESLSGRLNMWREERDNEAKAREQQAEAERNARELTQEALEDVRVYEEKVKNSRRQSLIYRLDKAKKDKNFEKGQAGLQQACFEEEVRLRNLERLDVKRYCDELQSARRQSLQYRSQVAHQESMRMAGELHTKQLDELADTELRTAVWRDVKAYQEKQREDRRKSIAWRIAESRRQKEVELGIHSEKMSGMLREIERRHQDYLDVKHSEAGEKERRRMSVVLRLDSWRMQKMAEQKLSEKKRMIAEEDSRLAAVDRENLLYVQREMKLLEKSENNGAF